MRKNVGTLLRVRVRGNTFGAAATTSTDDSEKKDEPLEQEEEDVVEVGVASKTLADQILGPRRKLLQEGAVVAETQQADKRHDTSDDSSADDTSDDGDDDDDEDTVELDITVDGDGRAHVEEDDEEHLDDEGLQGGRGGHDEGSADSQPPWGEEYVLHGEENPPRQPRKHDRAAEVPPSFLDRGENEFAETATGGGPAMIV